MAIVIAAVLSLALAYFMRLWSYPADRMTSGLWMREVHMTNIAKAVILIIALLLILLARIPGTV